MSKLKTIPTIVACFFLVLILSGCFYISDRDFNDGKETTSNTNSEQNFENSEEVKSNDNLEQDVFVFAYPEYEIGDKKTIRITSRETIDNLESIPNIQAIIDSGLTLVKNHLIQQTENTTIYHLRGKTFNDNEYLTYAQYDGEAYARIATYYVDITAENVYLFQSVYYEDNQFDILILLN